MLPREEIPAMMDRARWLNTDTPLF